MDRLIDILGVSIGDIKQEVLKKISKLYDIKLGHNCFYIENVNFGGYNFLVTFSYDINGVITNIRIGNSFQEGVDMLKIANSLITYTTKLVGAPIIEVMYAARGVCLWEDLFNKIKMTYQVKGKYKDIEYKINYITFEITDFLVEINDDSLHRRLSNARKNTFSTNRCFKDNRKSENKKGASTEIKRSIQKNLRIILVCITVIIAAYLYAYSHRYQVSRNGNYIIDKWTGNIENIDR